MQFTKMQALGNDFVVLDHVRHPVTLTAEQIRFIADRHFGVGCDQVLIVAASDTDDADFNYRIYNADGSEVSQCGNGARCIARFLLEKGLADKPELVVATHTGRMTLRIEADDRVTVDMGVPEFRPERIPLLAGRQQAEYTVQVEDRQVNFVALALGNPHVIIQVDDVDRAPVESLGSRLERHERFPQRANIGFMQPLNAGEFRLRVWERGVGETLACGSGACAAAVAGRRLGLTGENAAALLRGGRLDIAWAGDASSVMMTGPAVSVFDGELELPN